ncbi:MAG: DNA polymerase III subunit beta [Clostridia bacterium]|nr:DNA polymerase III subunit beta [Clostridia bacterium]
MKIIFNRSAISTAVAPLMCAVSGKSTLSTIEGILIEAKIPDTCIMTTFDLEKGVRITVEAKVLEEGSYIINAQKFVQTLRVMEGEEVTLTVDQKLVACIFSGRSSHKMSALVGSDFPNIPELVSDRSFMIGQAVVKKMMNQVSFAMGVNDQRAVLNGTFWKITDDSLMMVACDSFKLAKCRKKTDLVNKNTNGNEHLEYKFIVPIKTMNELNRLICDDEEAMMQIYVTRKHIVFLIGELTFFSRLVDGEYIDYDRIIMNSHRITVKVDKRELVSALERAALVTEEKIAGSVRSHVKLEVAKDLMKISAVSSAGSTYDELFIEHVGDDLVIAFNNRYLIDSIKACNDESVILSMSSPLTSMNIEPVESHHNRKDAKKVLMGEVEEEEIFMLLPVRMKE